MNHFNIKSLTFYGVAIYSVLLLFKTVTTYGEKHLQAPPTIDGRYHFTLDTNLPNCKKSDSLVLNMQQSGIYLNASLLPMKSNADTTQQLSLTGILKNQQVSFSGKIAPEILCHHSNSPVHPSKSVTMQMQLIDQGKMTGQLTFNGIPQTMMFTAAKKPTQEKSQKLNNY
ncbi:hypothetical protein IQ259_03605 [Fortiea sp. LEGE XX443]|uniref:hypothetical protein n=1 Tax=Fortiea sp. LEGE XX443 TaxID=1828611 RepID=UPI001880BDA8|nr:hypothetical protein [Fortiea sp. LEGE XX443]MBE9004136.1 hypothetical protein [Fortiea sp. LEGE XX443]